MNLTLFTIPKAFRGLAAVHQRNALASWVRLNPVPRIILFGDDEGVSDVAREFGVEHCPDVTKTPWGTPYLDSVFALAQRGASGVIVYSNADMIYLQDLVDALEAVAHQPRFLMAGRRRDLDVPVAIDFSKATWRTELVARVRQEGRLHSPSGMDYFAFKSGSLGMPRFAVGRTGWDGWLVYHMRTTGAPLIDATSVVSAIHQNHDYSHSAFGASANVLGPEYDANIKLAGGYGCLMTLRDADWVLTHAGLQRPPIDRRLLAALSLKRPWQLIIGASRFVRLRRDRASRPSVPVA